MARVPMKEDRPLPDAPRAAITRGWDKGVASRLAGESHITAMDMVAKEMEDRWGVDRLRLVVPAEYRQAFDRQRYKVNQAIWHGEDLEALRVETAKMILAYQTLDAWARQHNVSPADRSRWLEAATEDGTVIVILLGGTRPDDVPHGGRKMAFWTLDEIGEYLSHETLVNKTKTIWAGAKVVRSRAPLDPLAGVIDSRAAIDDEIPF
jgi:hypothetical protein